MNRSFPSKKKKRVKRITGEEITRNVRYMVHSGKAE